MSTAVRLLIVLGVSAAPAPAFAQGLSMIGATPNGEAAYLAGAAQGIMLMNLHAAISGGAVFCPPANFALTGADVRDLANESLAGEHEPFTFLLAATDTLRTRFPCS
jgi:hypothetical protein